MANPVSLLIPVGRIVNGSLYEANTKDADGNPLTIKNGPNAGQARVQYFIALAIKKGAEQNWWETEWGKTIAQVGMQAFPQAAQSPSFAWKVENGDSQIPNTKGVKNVDREGWPGHWVLKITSGFAPKIYRQEGNAFVQLTEAGIVKPGSFIEVRIKVEGNDSVQKPGVYLNLELVCFRAYGPEIIFGPNVNEAGFGQAPLPPGASMTPPASSVPMPATTAPGVPAVAPAPSSVPAVPGMPAPATAIAPPAGVPVVPNQQFLQVPAPGPTQPAGTPTPGNGTGVPSAATVGVTAPAPMTQTPPSNGRQMTAKAGATTYEAFIQNGWNEAMLIQHGYMTA